ncbi:hypothetical protein [Bordetella sp. LUAb4]|uniref:hypothetical protein n=1 Tax=Bordetella sp. LUAb4 TaxID=2843195 RepID=UPI001E297398|nr:hypothetical protein [Bordetella sp. LUAb4]
MAHSIKSVASNPSCIRCWYPGRVPRAVSAEARRERRQEKIAESFSGLSQALSIPAGKRRDAAIGKTVDTIEHLFQEVKRLVALMPDAEPQDDDTVMTVFEREAYRWVDTVSSTVFSRLCQGPLSPLAEQGDASYRDALLMRMHRRMHLPAESVLVSLEQALQGRHLDQVHAMWLFKAQHQLRNRSTGALARRAACLTAEQDRRKLQSSLHGIFLNVSNGQPDTLDAGVGILLALAKLPVAVQSIYQRCLPFGILNEARQELQRLRIPTPLAIDEAQWRGYCQSWKHEYARRVVALDSVIGDLREACALSDAQAGIRSRRTVLGLSQLAGLIRVGLAGEVPGCSPAAAPLDPARHGDIGARYAGVVEVVKAAANVLGLHDGAGAAQDPSQIQSHAVPAQRQQTGPERALSAMSDKEFTALVSTLDVMPAFGLHVDARAIAAERERRVVLLGQARLTPCLERLAATVAPLAAPVAPPPLVIEPAAFAGAAEDPQQMSRVGAYLRDATDALQAVVMLYSACGGALDGAEETAAFIEKTVNLALPDLHIAPARAHVLRRLSVALNHARVDLARQDPGLLYVDADDLLSQEALMQGIADRLARQEDVPDVIEGAFFTLIRRTSFAARLGAFVSSAPARLGADEAEPDVADFDEDDDVLADADIRLALQSDFGIEVVVQAPALGAVDPNAQAQDAMEQETVAQDALGRYVRWPDWTKPLAVREIYREELSFKDPPIEKLPGLAATGAPGTYPVTAAVVDEEYAKDYLRGSCSLSVHGRTPDGTPVSFDAAMARPMVERQGLAPQVDRRARSNAVEDALRCLSRMVDAGQFQQLTRLLSQMAPAAISVAEMRSAVSTPLRLASGTPLGVGGPAHTHTLIEQNLDGTFDMSYHVEWLNVRAGSLVDLETYLPSGPLELDPELSRKAVRYAWRVSANDPPVVQPLQLPEYRYCLVPAPMSRSSSILPANA